MKFFLLLAALLVGALGAQRGLKINHRKPVPRVVGGEDAVDGQFPHQVSLHWYNGNSYEHVCGGSIISPTWIVTAAHCRTEFSSDDYVIVAGTIDFNNVDDGQYHSVVEIIIHPSFEGGVNPNDIALMRMESPLEYNDFVQAIALPKADVVPTGDAIISGWGSTFTGWDLVMPEKLQTAVLPLLTIDECAEALFEIAGTIEPLIMSNLCTGPLSGDKGTCNGDSGGPLIQNNQLIGIASWGFFPCGTPGAPNVFTRVSAFTEFINLHVTDL